MNSLIKEYGLPLVPEAAIALGETLVLSRHGRNCIKQN
jgi:hypothetical protein